MPGTVTRPEYPPVDRFLPNRGPRVTLLQLATRPAAALAADALVLGLAKGPDGPVLAAPKGLPAEALEHLAAAARTLSLKGSPDEVARVVAVPGVTAGSVVLTGLGPAAEAAYNGVVLRRAAGAALRSLVGRAAEVALALPTPDVASVTAVADGAYVGTYQYEARATGPAVTLTVVSGAGRGAAVKSAVERAGVVGAARQLAMDLVTEPANLLTPEIFVQRVRAEVRSSPAKVTVSVMDEVALARAGCGGIIGVGQGSDNPPRMVTLTYKPARAKASIALVGKGITFDTGGYRLKPIEGMLTMKHDMAGAADVLATVLAVAELGLPVAVTGWLCLAENMISGNAQRPGDVVTMRTGMTVEILDPDAEGRMVLGDGMALASERKPDVMVDIATLTGMQMTALGRRIAGLMGNDDAFVSRVAEAAASAGEAMWVMPLPEDYRGSLDSPVADITHKAEAWGGMLTAGIFLKEFVGEGIAWAHIDMAGPSWNPLGAYGNVPKGATGYGVSTLVELVESYA